MQSVMVSYRHLPIVATVVVMAAMQFRNVDCRSPRILTGTKWIPLPANSEVTTGGPVAVKASGSEPQEYLLPPPSDTRYSNMEPPPHVFVPLNYPSIENHRLPGNWSKLVDNSTTSNSSTIQMNDNEVSETASVPLYTSINSTVVAASASPAPALPQNTKARRRVNVEKFRECIFFHLCDDKSECFHYGRFGQCKKKGLLSKIKAAGTKAPVLVQQFERSLK